VALNNASTDAYLGIREVLPHCDFSKFQLTLRYWRPMYLWYVSSKHKCEDGDLTNRAGRMSSSNRISLDRIMVFECYSRG
jgi:hypothetical protein